MYGGPTNTPDISSSPPRTPALPVTESPTGPTIDRLVSVILVGLAGTFTYLLASIRPDARGHGTHEQLGMSPCGWPESMNAPCPTCGVTTAAAHLVHLDPLAAIATQPFGAVFAFTGLWLGAYSAYCLVRRQSLFDRLLRLPHTTLLVGGIALLLGSWLYKYLTFTP